MQAFFACFFLTFISFGELGLGKIDLFSPQPREIFARLPVPILMRATDTESSDHLKLIVEMNGNFVERADSEQKGTEVWFETYLYDLKDGGYELKLFLDQGGILMNEYYLLNISVNTNMDQEDLIRYIPPIMSVRPRVVHWLVSQKEDDESVSRLQDQQADSSHKYVGSIGDTGINNELSALLQAYASKHRAVMSNVGENFNSSFLIARHFPTSGLGNLFQSIISSALVALLTDRILVFDSFFVEEFLEFPQFSSTNYSQLFEYFGLSYIAQNSQHVLYKGEDWMLCESLQNHLSSQFVFLESDMYFAALLLNNEHYSLQLQSLFQGRLFSSLSGFLFRPRAELSRLIRDFHAQHLAGRPSVGIHVRTHTLGHPGYIEPYALQDRQGHFLNSYWKCAHLAAAAAAQQAEAVGGSDAVGDGAGEWEHFAPVVFVATDNEAVRQQAAIVYGPQVGAGLGLAAGLARQAG